MEMGRRVVLCNLDNLYESLYDALNQVHGDGAQGCPLQSAIWTTSTRASMMLSIRYMEMGRRVVLCNLDNLYESLFDALNQIHM